MIDASCSDVALRPNAVAAPDADEAPRADQDATDQHGSSQSSTVSATRGPARPAQPHLQFRRHGRPIPILIIDRNAVFRAGLASILAGSQFRVAASYGSLDELPDKAIGGRIWAALIGAENGVDDLLSSIGFLASRGVVVVVLSESAYAAEVLAAIEAGASAYLLRGEISSAILLKSLELVRLGGVIIPHGLMRDPAALVDQQEQHVSDAAAENIVNQLSSGELAILSLLTEGASNKQIARQLDIAESTVKVRLMFLLRKIRVSNRTQAAMWATQYLPKSSVTARSPHMSYTPG